MGHFGRRPIRLAWLALVFPSLLLCYLGQGALLLARPEAAAQPFFGVVPHGAAVYALVALAAPATVIASQALISGVFSLTQQAIQLGYFPRVEVRHTSGEAEGQIYVPALNWLLAAVCILLVLVFERSSRLAAAFGLAISGTMAITSVIYYLVARHTWGRSPAKSVAVLAAFLALDLPFFAANLLKFFDGGYLPLCAGAAFLAVMVTWRWGRDALRAYHAERVEGLDDFIASLPGRGVLRPEGAAVFMASSSVGAPPVMSHYVDRCGSLHKTVVLMTLVTEHLPTVPASERFELSELGGGVLPRRRPLRLHGHPPRRRGARPRGRRRAAPGRPPHGDVLPRARDLPGDRAGQARGAHRGVLRLPVAQRPQRQGLLRHPSAGGRRGRRPGRPATGVTSRGAATRAPAAARR